MMEVELIAFTPEHAIFTFAIKGISRVCFHQLACHKVTSISQQSQKYVNMDGFEYESPMSIEWSHERVAYWTHDDDAEGFNIKSKRICDAYDRIMHDIAFLYREMVKAGIPEEDARYVLPNACHTDVTVTMTAHELGDFLSCYYLAGTRWEIRQVSKMMYMLAKETAPDLFGTVVE